jgi:sec-independent protein translocase protein TatA
LGSFSVWHWLIVLAVVLLLFGRGKIPELMGDVAKGINSFKNGMKDDDKQSAETSAEAQPLNERPAPALANHEGQS